MAELTLIDSSSDGLSCPWPAIPAPGGIPLTVLAEHPCPYLPDRVAQNRAFVCDAMPPELYHDLMDAGFRRSGTFVYQPICPGCRECQPIRVPVESFAMSKSQRRVWRRNADLVVSVAKPLATDEKFDLYQRYLDSRHARKPEDTRQSFEQFLYTSPVDTIELTYRDPAGRLVGVGICDVCSRSLSTVYFYFDPAEARRGLGVFSTLYEIHLARRLGIQHYYLGYLVRGCPSMEYKARFAPSDVLLPQGCWIVNSDALALK